MRIQETVRKPMTEAKYLNVDNTDRYRPIIRLFYLKYEKLKYWLYQEEVYEELKEDAYFRERAADIKDVSYRLSCHIMGYELANLSLIQEEVVIVAHDLTPSDTAQLNKDLGEDIHIVNAVHSSSLWLLRARYMFLNV